MALLTVQVPTVAGITPTYAAVSASDTFAMASGHSYLLFVKNAGGSPDSVAVDDPISQDPGAAAAFNPDATISVTNGQERMIKLSPARFKNASTGLCTITHSFTTSVTCAVLLVEV
jgi:hypothetical protein